MNFVKLNLCLNVFDKSNQFIFLLFSPLTVSALLHWTLNAPLHYCGGDGGRSPPSSLRAEMHSAGQLEPKPSSSPLSQTDQDGIFETAGPRIGLSWLSGCTFNENKDCKFCPPSLTLKKGRGQGPAWLGKRLVPWPSGRTLSLPVSAHGGTFQPDLDTGAHRAHGVRSPVLDLQQLGPSSAHNVTLTLLPVPYENLSIIPEVQ